MDKSRKAIFILLSVALLALCLRSYVAWINRPNDATLVRQALLEAIQASREGRPGSAAELLGTSIKIDNVEVTSVQRQITDFIRKQRPNLTVDHPAPKIIGNEARIVSSVEIDLGLFGNRRLRQVTMIFRKEDSTEYLVIPTRKWHLVEVRTPESALSELMNE
jgi:hypothetical protein